MQRADLLADWPYAWWAEVLHPYAALIERPHIQVLRPASATQVLVRADSMSQVGQPCRPLRSCVEAAATHHPATSAKQLKKCQRGGFRNINQLCAHCQ